MKFEINEAIDLHSKVISCFDCPFKERNEYGPHCKIEAHSLIECYEAQQQYFEQIEKVNPRTEKLLDVHSSAPTVRN